jgi:hypothetical protein
MNDEQHVLKEMADVYLKKLFRLYGKLSSLKEFLAQAEINGDKDTEDYKKALHHYKNILKEENVIFEDIANDLDLLDFILDYINDVFIDENISFLDNDLDEDVDDEEDIEEYINDFEELDDNDTKFAELDVENIKIKPLSNDEIEHLELRLINDEILNYNYELNTFLNLNIKAQTLFRARLYLTDLLFQKKLDIYKQNIEIVRSLEGLLTVDFNMLDHKFVHDLNMLTFNLLKELSPNIFPYLKYNLLSVDKKLEKNYIENHYDINTALIEADAIYNKLDLIYTYRDEADDFYSDRFKFFRNQLLSISDEMYEKDYKNNINSIILKNYLVACLMSLSEEARVSVLNEKAYINEDEFGSDTNVDDDDNTIFYTDESNFSQSITIFEDIKANYQDKIKFKTYSYVEKTDF